MNTIVIALTIAAILFVAQCFRAFISIEVESDRSEIGVEGPRLREGLASDLELVQSRIAQEESTKFRGCKF